MHHDSSNKAADVVLERYRRTRDRAVIIAVAACTLALGVVIGVVFSATKRPAIARAGEAAVEMSSAFVEIARKVEPDDFGRRPLQQVRQHAGAAV